jgi:hypothetical protein
MSNNPFLKSKTNNRFSFLNDEEKLSCKETSNKNNHKNIEYDASQNSFTQTRVRDSYRPNNRRNNGTKREPPAPKIFVSPDTNDTTLFPDLAPIKNTVSKPSSQSLTNFKDILSTIVEDNPLQEQNNTIAPGWAKISRINNKTVIEYGPSTPRMIIQQQLEEKQCEDEPNYIMFKAINKMKHNWELHEKMYDLINGEGSYIDKFRLPPVYGPEYDTESDTESENDDIEYEDESNNY